MCQAKPHVWQSSKLGKFAELRKKIIFFSNFQAAINNFIQERGRSREDEGNKVNCKGTVWLREKTRKIGKNIGRNQTKKHIPFFGAMMKKH